MSIEMENPESVLEKADAASNWVAQMLLAHQVGDEDRFIKAHAEASCLLFDVTVELEQRQSES